MIDNIVLRLVSKKLYANGVGFFIGYSKHDVSSLKVSLKFEKVEYLNKTEDYDRDGALAFGIKGNDAHIMKDNGQGITCYKK